MLLTFFITFVFVSSISYCEGYLRKHQLNQKAFVKSSVQNEINSGLAFKNLYRWLRTLSLAELLPKEDAINAINEIRRDSTTITAMKEYYEDSWNKIEDSIRKENRSIKQVVGDKAATDLLKTVEKLDVYDPVSVKSFLQSPVFESMLGGILYEGIFEFLQRVDLIGNIVNNLPVIGPIRITFMKEFKNSLDKTLGGQIKGFLSSFNQVAVQRMVDFVLSPQNRISLAKANVRLVEAVITRPLSSSLPNKETSLNMKKFIWSTFTDTPNDEFDAIATRVYNSIGDTPIVDITPPESILDKVLEASPTTTKVLGKNLMKLLKTNEGKEIMKLLQDM